MVEKTEEQPKELVIDPKELKEGTCRIEEVLDGRFAVCKDGDGKIRIYEIEQEK